MPVSTREKYFEDLTQELNPTVWVTEWMSHVLMDVELSLHKGEDMVMHTCLKGIRHCLSTRGFGTDLVQKIVDAAPYTDEEKVAFNQAFRGESSVIQHRNVEPVVLLAIHCFLHVAFTYEQQK